jgi:BMFP domain-containing protein YqiC
VPDPEPEPTDLAQRVADLEARANVQGMALQDQATRINKLQAEVAALKARLDTTDPPPSFESIYVTVRAGTKTYAGTLPVEG